MTQHKFSDHTSTERVRNMNIDCSAIALKIKNFNIVITNHQLDLSEEAICVTVQMKGAC